MSAAALLIEARRRAGISQRELARRAGRKQSTIARWERGLMEPAFDALVEAVRACGLDLDLDLVRRDTSYGPLIEQQRRRAPGQRVTALSGFDLDAATRALDESGARYVLAGPVAATLHGSPVGPDHAVVVPDDRPRNMARLRQALDSVAGHVAKEHGQDRWELTGGGFLEVVPVPPGTAGYRDLRRDAEEIDVASRRLTVASMLDLIRIADASTDPADRVGLPALRALLEPPTKPADPLAAWRGEAA